MSLTFVKPTPEVNVNILLYGPPKTGKSLGAGSSTGPILYLNADRPNATRLVHGTYGEKIVEAHVDGLQTLVDATLEAETGQYRTVVLDTVGDTYRSLIEDLSGRALRPKIQEYGDTSVHLERFVRSMCEKPVNFVVVAHEVAQRDEETGSFERLPWTGTSNPALGSKLMGMVDIVGYTRVLEPEQEGGSYRYIAQLINARGVRGGDRFDVLGPWAPVDLALWEQKILAGPKPADNEGAKPEKEATPA